MTEPRLAHWTDMTLAERPELRLVITPGINPS